MWILFVVLAIIGIILAVLIFIIATEGRYFGKALIRWGYDRRSVSFEVRDDWKLWEHLIKRLDIRPTEELLDLGTQTGHLPRLVARQRGFRGHVVGIDWSEEMIQEAQRQTRLEGTESRSQFLCRDVQNTLPFPENTFSLVTMVTGLLNSLRAPELLFREIRRVLQPRGRVAFRFSLQPLRYAPIRKAEWVRSQLESLGFTYLETLSWTPTYEILVFRSPESSQ
ncbi:MAG: class I SAM-dependent methyltransferase [Candidatus Thorarchaeota archaeon]